VAQATIERATTDRPPSGRARRKPGALAKLKGLHRIVVSNERDRATLDAWGLSNYSVIPPGIDTAAISRHPLPLGDDVKVTLTKADVATRAVEFALT